MINYLISIGTILGGVFWIFNAGGTFMKDRDKPGNLFATIILLLIGACSILGGIKLWP